MLPLNDEVILRNSWCSANKYVSKKLSFFTVELLRAFITQMGLVKLQRDSYSVQSNLTYKGYIQDWCSVDHVLERLT